MKIVISLLLCFVFSQKGFCQINPDVLIFHDKEYHYKNKIYKKKDADELFKTNERAYKYYLKSKKIDTAIVGLIIGGGIVGGAYVRYSSDACEFDCKWPPAVMLAGSLVGFFSVLEILKSKNSRRKAINTFNTNPPSTLGDNLMKLDMDFTNNGIGLILSF